MAKKTKRSGHHADPAEDPDVARGEAAPAPAEAEAATPAPPPVPPPNATSGPRPLTRAQALAQLRRGGPDALQGSHIARTATSTVTAAAAAGEAAATAAASGRGGGHEERSEGSNTAFSKRDGDHDGDTDDEGTGKDDERKESAFAVEQHMRPHRRNSSTPSGDTEMEVLGRGSSAGHVYKAAAAADGIASGEDEGEGGEDASAPLNRTSRGRAMAVPTQPGNRAGNTDAAMAGTAAVTYAPEEPNSLPRMLRMQRAFETNMGRLYSFCATHVTEWPALAAEWIPDRKFDDPERDYTLQYLALGTQTIKGAPNQVRIMEVAVPNDASTEAMYGLYGDDDIGPQHQDEPNPEMEIDPGKLFKNVRGHFRCDQSITVDATVLKIRAMPAETNIIATTTGSGFIGVYNLVQDQNVDERGETVPDAILTGHKTGGFGLSWNMCKPGYIASGADDGYVNFWDIKHHITVDLVDRDGTDASPDLAGRECQPLHKLTGHRDIVTDVCWHATQGHLLASSSLDGDVRVWDIRVGATSITMHAAHTGGTTAAQFHPVGAFQLATAGVDGELRFWDIRRPKEALLELAYHGRAVTGLQWAPFNETVVASYGEDGRVVVWDLAKTSLPLEYSADALAPPEVSFAHIGHLGVVSDCSWCPGKGDDWLLASTDSFNGVHVYRPKETVVRDYLPPEMW